jgi:hypothetical protein
MSMPLDDQQLARHNMRILVQHLAILDEELASVGFESALREQLLLAWWRGTITNVPATDLAEVLRKLLDDNP